MNILFDRNSSPGFKPQEGLSPLQTQVDGAVGGFLKHATDWRSLAAMTAGGMAYRAGRIGMMGFNVGTYGPAPLRLASIVAGWSAEVSAFELTHRGLSTGSHLWKWSGWGGLRQGLLHSFITFGTLKGAGFSARGQNLLTRHFLQDAAMVAGHQAAFRLNISPRPEGSLAEQFLHAEATNLQLGAGLALAHGFAPGLKALEGGMDLASGDVSLPRFHPRPFRGVRNFQFMGPGLLESGLQMVEQGGESLRNADSFARLITGVLLATGAVGLYRLFTWWFDSRIEKAYHSPRPAEARLNALRVAENPRLTCYQPVTLGEIRTALLMSDAIFAKAENLEAVHSRLLLGSYRIFDLFFDSKSGELKEAFEILNPQPYYPPPEMTGEGLLHARIGRLIDLNQFADLAGEPLLTFRLAPADSRFYINDFQIAFLLKDLNPRAVRHLKLPYEGDLARLVAGPAHSPMGPVSIEKNAEGYLLKGAFHHEELYDELSPNYLTRNGRHVSEEGVLLRALDWIEYDDLPLRWLPPRRHHELEEFAWLRWVPGMAELRGIFSNPKESPEGREEALEAYLEALEVVPSREERFLKEERRALSILWKGEFERSNPKGMGFYHRPLAKIDEKLSPSLPGMEELLFERDPQTLTPEELAVQRDAERILMGDREAIRRAKVFYSSQEESISGNAGPNHYAVNLYVDPNSGRILAVGNRQYLPMERLGDSVELTIRVRALPADRGLHGDLEGFQASISTVNILGRASPAVKRIWSGMIGKPFQMSREDFFPEEGQEP